MKEKCCLKADIRALHVKRIDRKLRSKGIKKQLLNPLTDRIFREIVSEFEQAHVELFAVEKRVMSSFSRDKRIRTGGIGVIEKALACSADKGDAADFFIRCLEKRRTHQRAAEGFFQDGGKSFRDALGCLNDCLIEPMRPHCPFSPPKGVTSESPSSSAAVSLTPPKAESSLV